MKLKYAPINIPPTAKIAAINSINKNGLTTFQFINSFIVTVKTFPLVRSQFQ